MGPRLSLTRWISSGQPVPTYDFLMNQAKSHHVANYLFAGTKVDLVKSLTQRIYLTLTNSDRSLSLNLSAGPPSSLLSLTLFNNSNLLSKYTLSAGAGALRVTHLLTDRSAYLDGELDLTSGVGAASVKLINPAAASGRIQSGILVGSGVLRLSKTLLLGHERLVAFEAAGSTFNKEVVVSWLLSKSFGTGNALVSWCSNRLLGLSFSKALGRHTTAYCDVNVNASARPSPDGALQGRRAVSGLMGVKIEGQGISTKVGLDSDGTVASTMDLSAGDGLSLNLCVQLNSCGNKLGIGVTIDS